MLTDTLTTPRLHAERPTTAHAPFLRALFAEPAVADTLWPAHLGGPRSTKQADAILDEDIAHWAEHGFGPWILLDRATREPIGRGGLERSIVQGEPRTELLYALTSARHSRGLATELARATLDAAADDPRIDRVVAFTLTTNHASRRVMEKAGLRRVGEILHAGLPHVLFAS